MIISDNSDDNEVNNNHTSKNNDNVCQIKNCI